MEAHTPHMNRALWEVYVQDLEERKAVVEGLPDWHDPKWIAGMVAHYDRLLMRAFANEPPIPGQ